MKRFMVEGETDSANLAHVLMLLSRGSSGGGGGGSFSGGDASQGAQDRVFECKTCSRKFSSFQALGGHRASHKKPRLAGEAPAAQKHQNALARPKLHECSICGLEFSIGQALGGHMRRHRAVAAELIPPHAPTEKPVDPAGEKRGALCLGLDLNLSPSEEETNFCTLRLGPAIVDCPH